MADVLFFFLIISLFRQNSCSLFLAANKLMRSNRNLNGLNSRSITFCGNLTALRNYAKTLQRRSLHSAVACS